MRRLWFHQHLLNKLRGDGSMSWTTGLKEIVSFLLDGLDFFFFPLDLAAAETTQVALTAPSIG